MLVTGYRVYEDAGTVKGIFNVIFLTGIFCYWALKLTYINIAILIILLILNISRKADKKFYIIFGILFIIAVSLNLFLSTMSFV